jgi:hypothetical protein
VDCQYPHCIRILRDQTNRNGSYQSLVKDWLFDDSSNTTVLGFCLCSRRFHAALTVRFALNITTKVSGRSKAKLATVEMRRSQKSLPGATTSVCIVFPFQQWTLYSFQAEEECSDWSLRRTIERFPAAWNTTLVSPTLLFFFCWSCCLAEISNQATRIENDC